jgi:hypothetical protein
MREGTTGGDENFTHLEFLLGDLPGELDGGADIAEGTERLGTGAEGNDIGPPARLAQPLGDAVQLGVGTFLVLAVGIARQRGAQQPVEQDVAGALVERIVRAAPGPRAGYDSPWRACAPPRRPCGRNSTGPRR